MPRDIDNQIAQELSENHRIAVLVRIDLSTPIYLHSRFGEYDYDGNTYYGVGAFGNISVKNESAELNPERVSLSLEGIDLKFIDEVLGQNYQNRDVYIYKALLDDDDTILSGTIIKWFRGVSGNASISEKAGNTCQVTLEVSNFLAKWRRPSNLRYNDKTQQELYAGDTGLQYVIDAQKGKIWRGV